MKTTQKLKQEIFKEVQATGLFKQVQSKLKTQVLNLVEKESNQNKRQMGFQYEHPLLNKLRKYPLTSLCLDLMQEFLQSFKFKYTLSVFKKEINRDININRNALANNFNIQMKNPDAQAVLLSLVSQLVSGQIKINPNKSANAFTTNNNNEDNNVRINNFIGKQTVKQSDQTTASNFNKKNTNGIQDSSSSSITNSKVQFSQNNPSSSLINQKSNNSSLISAKQEAQKSSVVIDSSLKLSQNSISQVQQSSIVVPEKQDKNKKNKKKKQVQKPPEGATDLMGDLMSKFKTKDTKAQQEKKKQIFQQKRAFSEQKAKKVVDPSQSGANKIRGVSAGKMSSFLTKFGGAPAANTAKNQSYIEEQLDEFQQSKDSTRKNPLYSSSESGFDKSGYYDVSVDSNAINDYEYVQKAKKFGKKY